MSEPLQLHSYEYKPWSEFAVAYYSRDGGSVDTACSYADCFIEESRKRMRSAIEADAKQLAEIRADRAARKDEGRR